MTNEERTSRPYVDLEEYVGDLYRALGFVVTRDKLRWGNQIDLVAHRNVTGVGEVVVAIEVKQRKKQVSKDDVNAFANTARRLLDTGAATKAVMVTDGAYSRFCHEAVASDPRIELVHVRDLSRQLLAAEAPLARYVAEYEREPLSEHYIEIEAVPIDTSVTGERSVGSPRTSIELVRSLVSRPDYTAIVLADYGAGKTTSLRRLKYLLAQEYLAHRTARIPVFFPLREYVKHASLDHFIEATLRSELETPLAMSTFYLFLDERRFILLLDGFDEVSIQTTPDERAEHLLTLSPLLFGASPAVLSTRPSYFASRSEFVKSLEQVLQSMSDSTPSSLLTPDELAAQLSTHLRARQASPTRQRQTGGSYLEYQLEPLSPTQIDQFFESYDAVFRERGLGDWREVRERVDGIYDLQDLMTRPIILGMIVETLIKGLLLGTTGGELGPTHLYEAYTQAKLGIDLDKSESHQLGLSTEQRVDFAIACALSMQRSRRLDVSLRECRDIAAKAVPDRDDSVSREHVLTDLRTCSFLTTAGDGSLRFVHKSFQEFFVAKDIVKQVKRGDWSALDATLAREIMYFLGGYIGADGELSQAVNRRLTEPQFAVDRASLALRNLIGAMLHSRGVDSVDLDGLDLNGFVPDVLTLARISAHGTTLGYVRGGLVNMLDCDIDCAIHFGSTEGNGGRAISLERVKGRVELTGVVGEVAAAGSRMFFAVAGVIDTLSVLQSSTVRLALVGRQPAVREASAVESALLLEGTGAVRTITASSGGVFTSTGVSVKPDARPRSLGQPSVALRRSVGLLTGVTSGLVECSESVIVLRGETDDTIELTAKESVVVATGHGETVLAPTTGKVVLLCEPGALLRPKDSNDTDGIQGVAFLPSFGQIKERVVEMRWPGFAEVAVTADQYSRLRSVFARSARALTDERDFLVFTRVLFDMGEAADVSELMVPTTDALASMSLDLLSPLRRVASALAERAG